MCRAKCGSVVFVTFVLCVIWSARCEDGVCIECCLDALWDVGRWPSDGRRR